MTQAEDIEKRLKTAFADAEVKLQDLTGGGDHWQLHIRSSAFQGKSLIEQHQMVYKALGELMKKEIHALKLSTSEL